MLTTDFAGLCKKYFEQRNVCDEIDQKLAEEKKVLESLKVQVLEAMDAAEQDKVSIAGHGTLYKVNRFTVQTPKSIDEKKALFAFWEERGIFYELASVNSQTLNSWYKKEMEDAVSRGDEGFKIPGIGEPIHSISLNARRE